MSIRNTALILLILAAVAPARAGDEAVRKEIEGFFSRLGAVLEKKDGQAFADLVDYGALLDEVERQSGRAVVTEELRDRAILAIRGRFAKGGLDLMEGAWKDSRIRQVRQTGDENVFVVIRRVVYDSGPARERWWLTRDKAGAWRFFDSEDLAYGMRLSSVTAIGVGAIGTLDRLSVLRFTLAFQAAQLAVMREDYEGAVSHLTKIEDIDLPPRIEALRCLVLAWALAALDEPQRALDETNAAAEQFPDLPAVILLRAACLLELDRHEEARQAAVRHRALTADSPEGMLIEGLALDGLGRKEAARKLLFRALTEEPHHEEILFEWGRLLSPERKGDLAERFAALPTALDRFEEFAADYLDVGDSDAVLALVGAYRRLAPKDPDADYYEAIALSLREEHGKAAKLLLGAIPRVTDPEDRRFYEEVYLDEMQMLEKPVHGLLAFPGDKAWAFDYLAEGLLDDEEWVKLISLVEFYRETGADDIALLYYSGKTNAWNGWTDDAEADFEKGLERAKTLADRVRFREAFIENRYESKKGLTAYGKFEPRRKTFWQLARLYAEDEDAEGLTSLLLLHAEADPEDDSLHYWRMEIAWLERDYEAVAAIHEKHRRTIYGREGDRWRPEDRIVRALAREGKHEAALAEARVVDERGGDPWYETVVWAVKGDEGKVFLGLAGILEAGFDLDDVYADIDLGPALRGEKLAKVRERYPEPGV